ncbi:Uncharacterised protein [Mycobacteroides abscessus subsp. abscessus]|nr:Uncharacterised protein [Mycobacteroides abscessus subsp. abscessus]
MKVNLSGDINEKPRTGRETIQYFIDGKIKEAEFFAKIRSALRDCRKLYTLEELLIHQKRRWMITALNDCFILLQIYF